MNAQEFIADYEANLPPLSEPTKELRAWMLLGSGWQPGDGPTPGVWSAGKPAGHRCLWSCKWSTGSHGVVGPDRLYPLESMTIAELVGECLDLAYIRGRDPAVASKVIPAVLDYYSAGNVAGIPRLIPILHQLRQIYSEYCWAPDSPALDGPGRMMYLSMRPGPGWWDKSDFLGGVPTVSLA